MNCREASVNLGVGRFECGQWWNGHAQKAYFCERQHRQIAYLRSSFMTFTQYLPVLFHIDHQVQNGFHTVQLSQESAQHFEKVKELALQVNLEMCKSNLFSNAAPVQVDGQYYYCKRYLTVESINKYLYMEQLGIGVKVLWCNHQLGEIVMEAGIVLQTFVRCQMNVPELQQSLIDQINFIQLTLRKIGVAHCDIKPENIVVTNSATGVRLHLIDMDDAVLFGQTRVIGTPTRNLMNFGDHMGMPADEHTDELGFQYIKNYLYINEFQDMPMIQF